MANPGKGGRAGFVAGGLLLVLGGYWAYTLVAGPRIGTPLSTGGTSRSAPGVAIRTPGGEMSLADLRGRVVLVDFWATWCPPCKESIPHVEALYRKYHDQGFDVIGASLDESDEVLPPFVKEMGITYPVGRLVDPQSAGAFGVHGIPTIALVDKQGKVRWRTDGYDEGMEATLARHIEALLKE